jgi:hypothetical protein
VDASPLPGSTGGTSGAASGVSAAGAATGAPAALTATLSVEASGVPLSATLPLGDDKHSTTMRRLLQAPQDGGDGVVPLLTPSTARAIRRYGLYGMPDAGARVASPGRRTPEVAARKRKEWNAIGGWYADSTRLPVLKLEATLGQLGSASGGSAGATDALAPPHFVAAPPHFVAAPPPPHAVPAQLPTVHTHGIPRVSFDESAAAQSPASAQLVASMTAAAAAAAGAAAGTPGAHHGRYHVAILGGSFSPITDGHLQIAAEVVASRAADEVWIVPCGPRPDKPALNVDVCHRYAMAVLAVEAAFPADFPVRVMPLETWEGVALPS